jgi:hypothetical protein
MLENIKIEIDELEQSGKRSKSVMVHARLPLPIYKLLYYYMNSNNIDNKTEAISDLIQYGFSYYSERLD